MRLYDNAATLSFCPSWMQQGIIYEGVGEGFECLAISLSLAATPVSPCCKNHGFCL